ncbi:MAG: ADP-glyceromanno-heptose 6-epimerase [bacterium]|jgi:ADP-L-glycero-D-manno-heptose 6-epimerase
MATRRSGQRKKSKDSHRPVHAETRPKSDSLSVIVTGGAGFIGSNLAMELEHLGHDVVVVDDFRYGDFRNLKGFRGDLMSHDIRQVPWEEIAGDFDVVFHQAAITDTRVSDQQLVLDVNLEASRQILHACINSGTKLIYASSAAVYGNLPAPYREDGPTDPLNIYGYSKLKFDQYVASIAEEEGGEIEVIGLRYFNVFGPGERYKGDFASMVFQMTKQAIESGKVKLFKYGEQYRDHLHVRNIVQANLKAMNFDGFGIFNVGLGMGTTFNRILEAVKEGLGKEITVEWIDNPYSFYQDHTVADIAAARALLGYSPDNDPYPSMVEYVRQIAAGVC